MSHQRTVYLVDDDAGDRLYLAFRLGAAGYEAWPFSTAEAFLKSVGGLKPETVLLSADLQSTGGAQLVGELIQRGLDWPVVAMSGRADVETAVEVMKLGALDFLTKPLDEKKLLSSLAHAALALETRVSAAETRRLAQARVGGLTAREIDISLALLSGRPNKVVAHQLGISVRTVEAHRANIMGKLGVRSVAEVYMLLTQAGLTTMAVPEPAAVRRAVPVPAPSSTRTNGRGLDSMRDHPLIRAA